MAVEFIVLYFLIYLIYKQLISDQSSSNDFDDFDFQKSSEKGWKILHGDVFRPPSHAATLSCLVGSGCQLLLTVVLFAGASALLSVDQPRNWPCDLVVLVYVGTSVVAGFGGAAIGNSVGVQKWLRVSLGSALLAPLALGALLLVVSVASKFAGFARSLSFAGFAAAVAVIVALVAPLSAYGGLAAWRARRLCDPPCQVAAVARLVPRLPLPALAMALIVGFFVAIPILAELFYVLSAFWKVQIFIAWHLLLATVVLLALIAGGFTVLLVYTLLQYEYHRWQWLAFAAPSTTGLFTIVVGACFFVWKEVPRDAYTVLYFGVTTGALAIIVALVCGSSGFIAATWFVRLIFSNLKLD
jgi:hypothetical protein